ncbi:MAG: hypothetical protein SD837_06665 [Candidatus Electrothrix scaldis]|nr:MAG: hypothetical protein SD837_06665 [Candidatus Electrothrix sp. GW3-3]
MASFLFDDFFQNVFLSNKGISGYNPINRTNILLNLHSKNCSTVKQSSKALLPVSFPFISSPLTTLLFRLFALTQPGSSRHLILITIPAVLHLYPGKNLRGQITKILFYRLKIITRRISLGKQPVVGIQGCLRLAYLGIIGGNGEAIA